MLMKRMNMKRTIKPTTLAVLASGVALVAGSVGYSIGAGRLPAILNIPAYFEDVSKYKPDLKRWLALSDQRKNMWCLQYEFIGTDKVGKDGSIYFNTAVTEFGILHKTTMEYIYNSQCELKCKYSDGTDLAPCKAIMKGWQYHRPKS